MKILASKNSEKNSGQAGIYRGVPTQKSEENQLN